MSLAPTRNSEHTPGMDLTLERNQEQNGDTHKHTDTMTEPDEEESTNMDISCSETSSQEEAMISSSPTIQRSHKRKRTMEPSEGLIRVDPLEIPHDAIQVINSSSNVKRLKAKLKGDTGVQTTAIPQSHGDPLRKLFHGLTIPLWQRILGYVPPVFLGRILKVNRFFHAILDHNSRFRIQGIDTPDTDPDMIWKASRKRFASGLPRNLVGQSDLDLWRLLRGSGCQICHNNLPLVTSAPLKDPWQAPIDAGGHVRVIWPFGIRLCKECLRRTSEQERQLLTSSKFPSFLLPAIPAAFVTQSGDYVFTTTVKKHDCPSTTKLSKIFFVPHIDEIRGRFMATKELGQGSTEEWLKGLEEEGQERIARINSWEQWDNKGGLKKVNTRPSTKNMAKLRTSQRINDSNEQDLKLSPSETGPLPIPVVPSNNTGLHQTHIAATGSTDEHVAKPNGETTIQRQGRSLQDVNEAKAIRRSEIERRCSILVPPLPPELLRHMESFQAALQISTPLTDRAWEVLRPRLIAQRARAEDIEKELSSQFRSLEAQTRDNQSGLYHTRESNASAERPENVEELIQIPLRDRLSKYADEVIQHRWSNGHAITKDNCPKFAVDVLLHARKRFYEDMSSDHTKPSSSEDNIEAPSLANQDNKLILEHMKWLYDNKIKGHTEHYQRELFLCSGCTGISKFYGFEAVIQHYAAKHTTALSQGSVVVHWRAEWPDPPPFDTNFSSIDGFANAVTTTSNDLSLTQTIMTTSAGNREATGFRQYQYPKAHEDPVTGSDGFPGYQGPYQIYHPPQQYIQQNFTGASPAHAQIYSPLYTASTSPSPYANPPPPGSITRSVDNPGYGANTGQNLQGHFRSHSTYTSPVYSFGSPVYLHQNQSQIDEMAKDARDIWFALSGIKDFPQSLRIYVVIQHVEARFTGKFAQGIELLMFIQGLDNHALMRPVRNVNGLACKACAVSENSQAQRKLFTFPHLLNHFKAEHQYGKVSLHDSQMEHHARKLHWTQDMIELPQNQDIFDLVKAPGMTDAKLQLLATALPNVFPEPLPSISLLRSSNHVPIELDSRAEYSTLQPRTNEQIPLPKSDNHSNEDTVSHYKQITLLSSRTPSGSTDSVAEGEYDPHRPTFLGRIVEHHQVSHPLTKPLGHGASEDRSPSAENRQLQKEGPYHDRRDLEHNYNSGPYGKQLLRHNRATQHVPQHNLAYGHVVDDQFIDTRTGHNFETVLAENFLRDLGSVDHPNSHYSQRPSLEADSIPSTTKPPRYVSVPMDPRQNGATSRGETRVFSKSPSELELPHYREIHRIGRNESTTHQMRDIYAAERRHFVDARSLEYNRVADAASWEANGYAVRPVGELRQQNRQNISGIPLKGYSYDTHLERISHPSSFDDHYLGGTSGHSTSKLVEYIPVPPSEQTHQYIIRYRSPPDSNRSGYTYESGYHPSH